MNFWTRIAAETRLIDFPDTPHGPIGLIYPNAYNVGMASLGYQQVYRLFSESGFSVERVLYDKTGGETRSLDNKTPLFRFPILAATYTYELDILNLLRMLIRGGVAPLAERRDEGAPLLIVGGQAATANPRLLERFADVIALGEGETVIHRIAETLKRTEGQGRFAQLDALAELPHLYVPAVHGRFDPNVMRAHSQEEIDEHDCHSVILADDDEFGGAFLLELSRGCRYRCKFCIVHYMNGTARYRRLENLVAVLERHQARFRKVGLLGAAVADHPQVEDVAEWLVRHGKQVSTSSLRAERITERFLDLLREGGQHTITVAPETGGIETRKDLGKGVKDEKYFRLAEWAGKRRFPNLKLYFLIGTPGADPMQEAEEIIEFGQAMGERFSRAGGGRLTVTVSPFAPKPTTPWAEADLWDAKAVKKASRLIRKYLAFRGAVKVPPVNVKEARVETLLSWAGVEATDDLLRLAQDEISLEAAFKDFDLDQLKRRAEETTLPHESVLKYRALARR